MSVPYAPPSLNTLPQLLRRLGVTNFYIQVFQEEGRADAELDRDPYDSLIRIYHAASGEAVEGAQFAFVPDEGLLAQAPRPECLSFLDETTLREMAEDFARSGFRGGLNWYRNMEPNAGLLRPWFGQPIAQPSLFVAGARDAVLKFPGSRSAMQAHAVTLPGLRGNVLVEGAGHWVQQERPAEVNAALLDFLRQL
jgi:pimeloyl-ACP methyl ester carboxylesterase